MKFALLVLMAGLLSQGCGLKLEKSDWIYCYDSSANKAMPLDHRQVFVVSDYKTVGRNYYGFQTFLFNNGTLNIPSKVHKPFCFLFRQDSVNYVNFNLFKIGWDHDQRYARWAVGHPEKWREKLPTGTDDVTIFTAVALTDDLHKICPNEDLPPGDYMFVHRILEPSMVGDWWTDCFLFTVE